MGVENEETQRKTSVGKMIGGRYEIEKSLGRGGMGKVYKVLDRQTGETLALKMIRSQYQANGKAVARFDREVAAVRQLNHPCIVKIYDAKRDGNLLFYTMEYVRGKNLRDWMRERGQLGLGSVVRVLCLVSHALEHAHKVTIHRDLSPENVMVLPDGSVRLLDFGLAKLTDDNAALTQVGVSLGKILYVAPEQRLSAAEVDHRADIYPLGIMFYEMLAGELPKLGTKLTDLRPDLPPECDAFCEKAAASDPVDRYASAAEFHSALRELYALYEAYQATNEERAAGARRLKIFGAKKATPSNTAVGQDAAPRRTGYLARLSALVGRLFRRA